MEAGGNLLSSSMSFPARIHLRNYPSSGHVLMRHELLVPAATSLPTSIPRNFPASVCFQEQRDEYRLLLHTVREGRTSQVTLDGKQKEMGVSFDKDNFNDFDQYLKDFGRQLLQWPGLWYLASLQPGEASSLSLTMQSATTQREKLMDVEPQNVVALAKKALSASKQAASLAQDVKLFGMDIDNSDSPGLESTSLADLPLEEDKTVRSTRLLERRSKKRRRPQSRFVVPDTLNARRADLQRKIREGFDPNDPLRLFLSGPETKQLLTAKEESELIAQIQDLMRLEEVKGRLQFHFNREPTLIEWAEAVGVNSQFLQSQLRSGNRSRERLIIANFRMVVHIAKQYQGRGLSLQDLLQEGSMGLMKSVQKFKPQAGCRFATYAYWWIRQAIRKAIFKHSRIIRLPDSVYECLSKVLEAKRSYIQEGHHSPTNEEIAVRAGLTVEKLQRLRLYTRMPVSMQQPVWADQDTTFQEITADTEVETPDLSVAKQLMRQHARNLLVVLTPRERQIIRLRFGILDGKPRSLSGIGALLGLSKERIRQLESRALYKLRQCLDSHGLKAYTDLLVQA